MIAIEAEQFDAFRRRADDDLALRIEASLRQHWREETAAMDEAALRGFVEACIAHTRQLGLFLTLSHFRLANLAMVCGTGLDRSSVDLRVILTQADLSEGERFAESWRRLSLEARA